VLAQNRQFSVFYSLQFHEK